jgi:hypothetical protein
MATDSSPELSLRWVAIAARYLRCANMSAVYSMVNVGNIFHPMYDANEQLTDE